MSHLETEGGYPPAMCPEHASSAPCALLLGMREFYALLTVHRYNWEKSYKQEPEASAMDPSSSFDHVVAILGIGPDQYKDSVPLKEWVQRNKDQKYVPTELLKCWGFEDDEAPENSSTQSKGLG